MRLARIAVVALLGIVLVSTIACGPASPCITHEEAIALAQDELDQTLLQIPCTVGLNQARAFCLVSTWTNWQDEPFNTEGSGAAGGWLVFNDETEYIVVRAILHIDTVDETVLWWRVYCDTKDVVSVLDTHTQIQRIITAYSVYCY
jgi:hypothetical protein